MPDSDLTPAGEDSQAQPPNREDGSKSRNEKIDDVVSILKGESDESKKPDEKPGDDATQREDAKKGSKPETLDAVAEALGIEVSDLYKIAIKQPGDGEDRVTIGELADFAKDRGQFEIDRLTFEDKRQKGEADLMRGAQQLQELVALIPKNQLKPELFQRLKERIDERATQERGLTLNVIPDWKDETVEETERAAMTEHLSAYGFTSNYLDTVQDHRTLKFIRDSWKRQQAMERAISMMEKKKRDGQKPGGGTGKAPVKPAEQSNTRRQGHRSSVADKTSRVAALLNSNEG